MTMPNIKPISDLRNYTEVLKEVSTNRPVYLTRNGRGAYAIVEVDESKALDDLQGIKTYISRQFGADRA